jgi:predicted ATP-dependent protease
MLREDVVEAVEQGDFNVHAVRTVDEALALLMGVPAGERDEEGEFPVGTINQRVETRLIELAEKQRAFSEGSTEEQTEEQAEASSSEE